jgi:hypothetical protein
VRVFGRFVGRVDEPTEGAFALPPTHSANDPKPILPPRIAAE